MCDVCCLLRHGRHAQQFRVGGGGLDVSVLGACVLLCMCMEAWRYV
jgi:hypothetical protein